MSTTNTITELTIWLPLPPVELSKNGRAHTLGRGSRHELFQSYKMQAISGINRVLTSAHQPWSGPVSVHIRWHQWNRGHWPDHGAVIERCACYIDAAEIETARSTGAGLFINDKQVIRQDVEYIKDQNEGVSITFRHEGAE